MPGPEHSVIRTPDQRVRVFVSSTLQELADERAAARKAITKLKLAPVMFELGARPHPPRELYRAYLDQSHIFVGIYWQRYGWVAPGESISGLEDEYGLSGDKPKLIYIKSPAPEREARLKELLTRIQEGDRASYKYFTTTGQLRNLIENDLALLLTERFESSELPGSARVRASSPAPADSLPTGTITFLFTDIEGSTHLWEQYPEQTRAALLRHDTLIEEIVSRNHGDVVRPRGEGDSRFAVFSIATDGVTAAASIQQALYAEPWPTPTPLRVGMALHTGEADLRDGDYYGSAVNRCARLRSAAHGGQVLLSDVTSGLVRDALPPGTQLKDMGEHRLKDLTRPEHVFQLSVSGLPAEFPPLKTLDYRPNNLPLQPTPLVGREKELGDMEKVLEREETRLVTLTGPGGVGKTRLGLQVASEVLDNYQDGVWFVDLSPLTDSGLVASTIASVLGVKEAGGGQPIIDTLKEYLKDKRVLLVLDNFEQVAEAAKEVSALIAACPNLKVLATSRVPLHIRGEKEYPVPPLSTPDVHNLPPLERLSQYEAVRLFIERATDAKPDFQVTNENAPAVAQICVRLDGLPLAIELAAARVRMLPPEALLARLSQRLKVLTGGAQDLPERQQTLRNTIEWSYDLLSEGEKQLFWRIAPFNGGRTIEAMEVVCNSEALQVYGQLGVDVFEGASSLLSKNLLREVEGSGGEPRFRMLETIHEYAREKLAESGEAEALYREHALYFMRLAEEAEPLLMGREQHDWLERLEEEYDNIRAALYWARSAAEGESKSEKGAERESDTEAEVADDEDRPVEAVPPVQIGLRIAVAIGRFWNLRAYNSEGREQLSALLELEKVLQAQQAQTRTNRVGLRMSGQLTDGAYPTSTGSEVNIEYKAMRAKALNWEGVMAADQGDFTSARSLCEESLAIFEELGNKWGIALSLTNLGQVMLEQGDQPSARSIYEESLAIRRDLGDKWGMASSLNNLGVVAQLQGDYVSARSLYEESLAIRRDLGDKWGMAISLHNLGVVAQLQGDYVSARSLYEESLVIARELGDRPGIVYLLAGLGEVEVRSAGSGDIASRVGTAGCSGAGETAEAGAIWATSELRKGARLLGAVDALLKSVGIVLWAEERRPYEFAVAQARTQLGEEEFEKAWAEGRAMSMEEAIQYALEAR